MRKETVKDLGLEVGRKLEGTYARSSHYTRYFEDSVEIDTEDDPIPGRINTVATFFCGALSDEALASATKVISKIKTRPTMRGKVVGKGALLPRINKEGEVTEVNEIPLRVSKLVGYSDTIGYLGPSSRFPNGRITAYTKSHLKARAGLTPVLREIDTLFYDWWPFGHQWQSESFGEENVYNWYDQCGDQTAFSSCYGNVGVRSAYHPDAANLGGSFSALFTMGEYEGGGLVIPRYGIAFMLQPGDLLLFHGDDVHGVLPFKGTRLSGVFFGAAHHNDFWEEGMEIPVPPPDAVPDI